MATSQLPTRSNPNAGYVSDDEPSGGDPSSTTGLLQERLQAYKHMCGYLEDYIKEVAKNQNSQAKDQDKLLKSLSHPLKETHHFDSALGGVSGLFEHLRTNTQAQSNLHTETSKNLMGQVLPILENLHAEIKSKSKELNSGAGKSAKAVDAARTSSQKHIDALGQHAASFDSSGGKVSANNDPYLLQRGTYHRLNKQILEENNSRQDTIGVQNSFAQFESQIITTVQSAMNSFNQFMSGQADRQKAMYGDVAATASNIPLDFEWNGFLQRNSNVLINPNSPPKTMEGITFPNQNHRATRPLIEGSLERKSRGIGMGYKSGYYAVSPAGYLHQFKDNDNSSSDPTPEVSLYLADCTIGAVDGQKFTIKGKDSSGSKIASKMAMSSEFQFKALTSADAQQWHNVIAAQTHATSGSVPTSPAESRNITPVTTRMQEPMGQQGSGGQVQPSAISPQSAEPQGAGYAPQSATSPVGQGKHFPGGPAQNQLGDREYVAKQ